MHWVLFLQLFSILAANFNITEGERVFGKIFSLGSNRSRLIGNLSIHEKLSSEGHQIINLDYTSPEGQPLLIEDYEFSEGKPISYEFRQEQVHEHGRLWVEGPTLHYDYQEQKGSEKLPENLFMTGNVVDFLQSNWVSLRRGDPVEGNLPVLPLKQTVTIKFLKDPQKPFDEPRGVVIKAVLSQWYLRWLGSASYFTLSEDGREIISYRGRIGIKKEVDGKFEDQDGEIVYEYLKDPAAK